MPSIANIAQIKQTAIDLGFDAIGICSPFAPNHALSNHMLWLTNGLGTGLTYLARNPEKRFNATFLLTSCQSVIVTALSYYHPDQYRRATSPPKVARYAQGDDYHLVMKDKLVSLAKWLTTLHPDIEWKATVDSSPIAEKAFAVEAGIGWRGKHSILINKELGSYFVIGLLLVSVELPHDSPLQDLCKACNRCVDTCPTNALETPYVLNANRCISYQTTARSGTLVDPIELHGWLYGCDVCQQVCPFNSHPRVSREARFLPHESLSSLTWETIRTATKYSWHSKHPNTDLGMRSIEKLKKTIPNDDDYVDGHST